MTQGTPERRVLFVHATGNANARQAALALEQSRMLAGFHTTIAWRPGSAVERLLPAGLRSELGRRSFPDLPQAKIHTHPWRELARMVALRKGWIGLIRDERGRFSFDQVSLALQRAVAASIGTDPLPDAVYVYDTCALKIMEAAKERGIRCIYDLPTGHYRAAFKIVEEERELRPEWESTLTGIHDSAEKLAGKDREIALADAIVVASSFTASTLETFPAPIGAPIFRIPYGAPPVGEKRELTRREDPLRVLFVGQMGHRKGLGYLIDAMDRLQVPANLTLVGRTHAVPPVLKRAFDRHRWIESAPHSEVLRLMREHDALVFPSLFDGFGLVMLEAMAQGTVVIATPNTAATDLFSDGRDAFIVPIRSADAIAARLTELAEDRDLLAQMSEAARQSASRRTWDEYRLRLIEAVTESIG
jgi:starch synthase